jgi:hypothetical protein
MLFPQFDGFIRRTLHTDQAVEILSQVQKEHTSQILVIIESQHCPNRRRVTNQIICTLKVFPDLGRSVTP